jgi:catechol 2,3-dioxygenase-like lactoylglutathione lyase family enzyme
MMERRFRSHALPFTVLMLVLGLACASAPERASSTPGGVPMSDAVVRYQVSNVDRAITFYERLGFELEQRSGAVFASVRRGDLRLLLSGPGSSGSRPMPDGRRQEPGGWNRIVLDVDDLASRIDVLRAAGVRFRNEIESGPGGKQIQIEDPDGNPIEIHEPPRPAAK